jgi:hypothetical protein
MKFSLAQLCGSQPVCCSSKEMVKWARSPMCWVSFSNNHARLHEVIDLMYLIIHLNIYWYSFSFHLGVYKKYAVKQKCSRVLWVLRFQRCSGFMRSRPFYELHWSLLVIAFKNSRQTLLVLTSKRINIFDFAC